jgi:hypothetical protein
VVAVYVIYWKGPALRARSPFAQRLAGERQENVEQGRRGSVAYDARRRSKSPESPDSIIHANNTSGSTATGASDVERPPVAARPSYGRQYSNSNRFFGESRVTPRGTPRGTPSASRRNSKHY